MRRRDALATAHGVRCLRDGRARLVAKYDAEGSGNISADAARAIVNEAVGKEVSDEVLRQLRSMCDCSPPDVTKPMRASDIQFLHQSSRAYGLQAERVTEVLRRYDLDKSGGLDFKELPEDDDGEEDEDEHHAISVGAAPKKSSMCQVL